MITSSTFLILYAGFTHAFETDHVLAVTNMSIARNKLIKSVKDGAFWGLGHTSTLLLIGIIFLVIKLHIPDNYFSYFEAGVGLMLIIMGVYRLAKGATNGIEGHHHTGDPHAHSHEPQASHSHLAAYMVGLVHGLAGSGVLILVVMSQSDAVSSGLLYLLIFGVGSVFGMMLAAGAFSFPFTRRILQYGKVKLILIVISSLLCIGYGAWIIYKNLWG
jgi:cytochrome c biogenesis protein CcdA